MIKDILCMLSSHDWGEYELAPDDMFISDRIRGYDPFVKRCKRCGKQEVFLQHWQQTERGDTP